MNFFIFDAFATTETSSQGSPYSLMVIFLIFGLIFYFMILRPQKKRTQMHKELIRSLTKGDEVLTTSGFVGRVIKISDTNYISIALNDTNEVVIKRTFVAALLPKGTMKAL
ncbi:preprotein translocase subunit YajC [Candidatus Curculioniphilus buchneri]|uniref:preprotein translocase subunit YajC n=1 Tax=Candidatus Curculioniphilus buchneri TaxID=690594 RepID=UPI00376EF92F